jgi:hypothetical protein
VTRKAIEDYSFLKMCPLLAQDASLLCGPVLYGPLLPVKSFGPWGFAAMS